MWYEIWLGLIEPFGKDPVEDLAFLLFAANSILLFSAVVYLMNKVGKKLNSNEDSTRK